MYRCFKKIPCKASMPSAFLLFFGNQPCRTRVLNNAVCHFIGYNLGVEISLKRRKHQKRVRWNRELDYLFTFCIWVSRKFHAKLPYRMFLLGFFGNQKNSKNLKVLFSFIPWLFNSSDMLSYGSSSRKRYTLRLL